jgi:hypothetical protein
LNVDDLVKKSRRSQLFFLTIFDLNQLSTDVVS